MSLPSSFNNAEEYFISCISFLRSYQHLYNYANTDILIHNALDEILVRDLDILDVFKQDFDLISHAEEDEVLKDFFHGLQRFQPRYDCGEKHLEEILKDFEVPLSPKKRHEIIHLAAKVAEACKASNSDTVVDFGSGLGYLDQLIFQTSDLQVLGIECNESHYTGAKTRQIKYHPDSTQRVKYVKHFIREDSHTNIQEYLNDNFENHKGFCIAGLHSCADLTVDAINLFFKIADAKAMALMPCCYHKMKITSENSEEQRFMNFPLSKSLRNIFEVHKGGEYLRVPFLRLATQPPHLIDGNLEDLVFNLLSRATLQLYAHNNNCKLRRNRRKAVKMKTSSVRDFATYIQDATTTGYKLVPLNNSNGLSGPEPSYNTEDLSTIWREICDQVTHKRAAILILLQNYLQPICENFVLYDRIVYFKENGIENCRFEKILNEKTSPRCMCLLAFKCKETLL